MNQNAPTILQQKLDSIRTDLFLSETEETWDRIARGIAALTTACNDVDTYSPTELVAVARSISRPLISAMNSERSRLSGVAIDLVSVVASCLAVAFDPLLAHFFPVLLVLSSRTSKVTVARARSCILTVIEATHLPSILPYLAQSVTDKSVSLRQTIVESTLACMNCFNPPDLEKDARAKDIETIIRATVRDASADVRKVSKKVFEAYKLLLPNRLESFTMPLTPTTRKYLDIQSKTTDKLKPSAHSKVSQFSSSTSAVRGPSSRRPPTHTRSASSPAIAPEAGASGVNAEHPHRSRKVDMAPPKLPVPIPTSGQTVAIRSTSVIDRTRVVSMSAAVRPAMPNTKLGVSEQGRPNPTANHLARRPQPVDEAHRPIQTTVVARRVPVSEVQTKLDADKAIRARPRIDNSASTPAMRPASATAAPLPGASKSRAALNAPNKDAVPRVAAKLKTKEPTKQRSFTQPTLSQLARAKTVERRVPVPTVSKPLRGKTASSKAPVSTTQPTPTVTVTPAPEKLTTSSTPQASTSSIVADHESQDAAATDEEDNASGSKEALDTSVPLRVDPPQSEVLDGEKQCGQVAGLGGPATPPKIERSINAATKTPISELLLSIERGFLFTPSAPLSPPESYLTLGPSADFAIPFPLRTMWSGAEQQNEEWDEGSNKASEGLRRPESRRALEDVAINK